MIKIMVVFKMIWWFIVEVFEKITGKRQQTNYNKSMQNELIQYIRDKNNTPLGVVVAQKRDNVIYYGYSLRNKKDKWNREVGIKIAIARANADSYVLPSSVKLTTLVLNALNDLNKRAVRYFKDAEVDEINFQ
jgi:hypothetical protein